MKNNVLSSTGLLLCLLHGACLEARSLASKEDPAYKVVNKKVSLGKYVPRDLVPFQDVQVSKRIVSDLKELLVAAKKDGLTLKVVSGYRSYERQEKLFAQYVEKELKKHKKLTRAEAIKKANRYSAQAGHSEHQLGTTVDILSAENGYVFSANKKLRYVVWLEKNAHRFNFKISFPENGSDYEYEPWHVRWYPSLLN